MATGTPVRSSFRDPSGSVHLTDTKVFRSISGSALHPLNDFLQTEAAQTLVALGKLIETYPSSEHAANAFEAEFSRPNESGFSLCEHPRIWFASYAHEWPPEMLYAAGDLTLEICERILTAGFGMKDATPYNVLYRGPKPIFVDVLSFERRDPVDQRWLPYEQFLRSFVLPLLLARQIGSRLDDIFLSHADGLRPEDVYRSLSWSKRLRPPFLTSVSVPTWLTKRVNPDDKNLYRSQAASSPDKAKFVLEMRFRSARKLLEHAKPRTDRDSVWSSYSNEMSYSSDEFDRKSELIRRWTSDHKPATVLDIGCNTGHFSEIAARSGSKVVAVDLDPVVVGRTWRRAVQRDLDILPLIVNLARPTPAIGWRNTEYSSFIERSTGVFETVMMLAVLHHLLVTERIPLEEILDLAAQLTTRYLVLEFVDKNDSMFQRLTRGREHLHSHFSQAFFETTCNRQFKILEKHPVKGDLRWLYLLQKK